MSVSGIDNNYLLYTQYLPQATQSGNGCAGSSGQVQGCQSSSGGGNTLMKAIEGVLGNLGLS
ncbi:MAG: hypothetical protein ABSC04_02630 [Syntrophobacteraceae bacterium]|jgi:hypothetical protein